MAFHPLQSSPEIKGREACFPNFPSSLQRVLMVWQSTCYEPSKVDPGQERRHKGTLSELTSQILIPFIPSQNGL